MMPAVRDPFCVGCVTFQILPLQFDPVVVGKVGVQGAVCHVQKVENVGVGIFIEGHTANALHNVACQRHAPVGVGGDLAGSKDLSGLDGSQIGFQR